MKTLIDISLLKSKQKKRKAAFEEDDILN